MIRDSVRLSVSFAVMIGAVLLVFFYHGRTSNSYERDDRIITAEAEFLGDMLKEKRTMAVTQLSMLNQSIDSMLGQLLDDNGDTDLIQWIYSDIEIEKLRGQDAYCVTASYKENDAQELFVDNAIPVIIKDAGILSSNDDSTKVQKICEYLKDNYSYDSSLECDTVYRLLEEKKFTCQSISILIYKILRRIGVKCRIAAGYYRSSPHGWVQVLKERKWRNLDFTAWADTGEFFLVTDKENYGHTLAEQYQFRVCR